MFASAKYWGVGTQPINDGVVMVVLVLATVLVTAAASVSEVATVVVLMMVVVVLIGASVSVIVSVAMHPFLFSNKWYSSAHVPTVHPALPAASHLRHVFTLSPPEQSAQTRSVLAVAAVNSNSPSMQTVKLAGAVVVTGVVSMSASTSSFHSQITVGQLVASVAAMHTFQMALVCLLSPVGLHPACSTSPPSPSPSPSPG
jgi:hypothetical protein